MSFNPSTQHETAVSVCPAVDGYYYSTTFDPTPFAYGECRAAFRGIYHATIPYIGARNGKPCVSKVFFERHRDVVRGWKPDLQISTRANELAGEFNGRFPSNKPISFQVPIVARIVKLGHFNSADAAPARAVNSEHYVRLRIGDTVAIEDYLEGKYEKFNSNNGWVCDDSTLMPAFSHFTWWNTAGSLIVCDLQGVRRDDGYRLTDPAIHSLTEEYGMTDFGAQGIGLFFSSHKCNSICAGIPLPKMAELGNGAGTTAVRVSQSTSFALPVDAGRQAYNKQYVSTWRNTDQLQPITTIAE